MSTLNSVGGQIDAAALGVTLTHEHIFINMMREFRATGLLNEYGLMRSELNRFSAAGGATIVELTPAELTAGAAPDPKGIFGGTPDSGYPEHGTRTVNSVLNLRRLSQETGINLILGTGHYRDPYLDDGWLQARSVDEIAAVMVADIETGIAGTDVRAGIIGEIGADKWHISPVEERSFRAAAKAHLATGVSITTHAARWPIGIAQLDVLESEGVEPPRVIIGHCDMVDLPEYHLEVARRGAFVQFDTIQGGPEYEVERRVQYVRQLADAGHLGQILLSHDVHRKNHLHAMGGPGYDYVLTSFADRLIQVGFSRDDIHQLMVDNPRRALAGA